LLRQANLLTRRSWHEKIFSPNHLTSGPNHPGTDNRYPRDLERTPYRHPCGAETL